MNSLIRQAAGSILDLILPLTCAVCSKEGRYLCVECEPALTRLERPYCPKCAEPECEGLCERCVGLEPRIDSIRAPYRYLGAVRHMAHELKYRNLRAAAPTLGGLMADYLLSNPVPADVIVPVPLHSRRERQRGYNQSLLLAREIGKCFGTEVDGALLRRSKNTPPQVEMESPEDRRANMSDSFRCEASLEGRKVLLVDDIVTTGSTMFACADALKDAGAASVWGLALAR